MHDDDDGLDPEIAPALSEPDATPEPELNDAETASAEMRDDEMRDDEMHALVDSGAMGTGGLTFEPPSAPPGSDDDLAFAPDLDDDVMARADALFRGVPSAQWSNGDADAPGATNDDDGLHPLDSAQELANGKPTPGLQASSPRPPAQGQYPRAREVIARLRGGPPTEIHAAEIPATNIHAADVHAADVHATEEMLLPPEELTTTDFESPQVPLPVSSLPSLPFDDDDGDEDGGAANARYDVVPETKTPAAAEPTSDMSGFSIGNPIMRPPAEVATPATIDGGGHDERGTSQVRLESMVDTVVVGQNGDDAHGEVHLQFKDDVLRGLYVSLTREDDGFIAKFVVSDDTVRRQIDGEAATLVNRLRDRGMPVIGYRIEVRDGDQKPRTKSAFDDDKFDGF